MNKHNSIIAGFCAVAFALASCSDDFLEVKNPTGEPLEEYYTNEETLNEALTSAYAPLHWPDWDNAAYNDLTIDFAKRHDATAIVKGVRSVQDYEYERTQAEYNRLMSNGIETVILFADPQYASLSSSIVRTLKKFGKDVSDLLP